MRRIVRGSIAVPLVLLAVGVIPGTAGAGGGDWLETERRHVAIGDTTIARSTFNASVNYQDGRVSDGPFQAYLVRGQRWIDPGHVPASAVPLGALEITERGEWNDRATIRFTVPDVRPGLYAIDYCDVPCTVDGIGSLYGAQVWIGRTVLEARLLEDVTLLRDRAARQRDELRQGRDYEELRESRGRVVDRLALTEAELAAARERVSSIGARARSLEANQGVGPLGAVGIGVASLLAGVVLMVALRRGSPGGRSSTRRPRDRMEDVPAADAAPSAVPNGENEEDLVFRR